MNATLRGLIGTAAAIALAAAGVSSALPSSAATGPSTPIEHIIGGSSASSPYIVQLQFRQAGGTYGCTGEAISPEWVITAQHCTDGDTFMNVYYSNDTGNPGTPVAANAVYGSPNGDVGLIHLGAPTPVSSYGQLANAYTASSGDSGAIWGYGLRANQARADHLYMADISVLGASTDAYGGTAVHIQGVTGSSNHGDSGGPLIIGGVIVGVCSTGDQADPGADIHARSNYANLTGSRSWIASTSGV